MIRFEDASHPPSCSSGITAPLGCMGRGRAFHSTCVRRHTTPAWLVPPSSTSETPGAWLLLGPTSISPTAASGVARAGPPSSVVNPPPLGCFKSSDPSSCGGTSRLTRWYVWILSRDSRQSRRHHCRSWEAPIFSKAIRVLALASAR